MHTTDIGYATKTAVVLRGKDFSTEILGKMDFLDVVMLTAIGRVPTPQEKVMLNLILVTAAGHGITPSVLSARLTWLGAPEALQGAVAAGLLGGGSVYLGPIQNIAQSLLETCKDVDKDAAAATIRDLASGYLSAMKAAKKPVLGVGSGTHAEGDPRTPVIRELARENGFYGLHWRLMDGLAEVLSETKGRPFEVNGAGALAAVIADMGLDPLLGRGLMLTGRCASLVAHVLEERDRPIGQEVWDLVLREEGHKAAA
ncbi:citryl-CoA lyase [Ramlibacter sp. G-1-2-2]|uniref:citrate synthase (unknown stereospecificity) n=1 Tax=Ramlibacter agri TaxID=2728837 RepID=A0A848HEB4_9BURK|nr:citryl-CoA lyase [Ramlibacter agri]NML48717.1 citryl-CoA lyase [Ramlibacter agri]